MTRLMSVLVLCFVAATAVAADPVTAPPPRVKKPVPSGVDPMMTSGDAEYGYTKDKPIKVGTPGMVGSPAAERAYLDLLRDDDRIPHIRAQSAILSKTGLHDRTQAALFAVRHKLTNEEPG